MSPRETTLFALLEQGELFVKEGNPRAGHACAMGARASAIEGRQAATSEDEHIGMQRIIDAAEVLLCEIAAVLDGFVAVDCPISTPNDDP